jgi:hypothetical protein
LEGSVYLAGEESGSKGKDFDVDVDQADDTLAFV